jgi:hypothetical protein
VSVPLGATGRAVCAAAGHLLEFVERESGRVRWLWELEPARQYEVLLTTAGGLCRYRLHDLVVVTGRFLRTPCVSFVGREGVVTDLVGEKLHLSHVEEVLRETVGPLEARVPFAMVAPGRQGSVAGYTLYVQAPADLGLDWGALAGRVEAGLCRNYHYLHARRLGQLNSLSVFRIEGDAVRAYRDRRVSAGARCGTVKVPALDPGLGWAEAFDGESIVSAEHCAVEG